MRCVSVEDFVKSPDPELHRILADDRITIGITQGEQLEVLLVSARRHGELISANAALHAICSSVADSMNVTRPNNPLTDKYMAEIIEAVSRQESITLTFIQVMFGAGHGKAKWIMDRLEVLGIVEKRTDGKKRKVLCRHIKDE